MWHFVAGENEARGIIHHQLYKNNQINFNKDKMSSSSDEDDEHARSPEYVSSDSSDSEISSEDSDK